MSDSTATILEQGIQDLGLNTPVEALMAYLRLLDKWNKAYNLTAIRDLDSMARLHIIDSLAVNQWLQGQRILDVGTGAGLPGIPLAINNPDKHFVLLDSNGKKTRFLNEVKRQLKLSNVEIVQIRSERYHCAQGFDTLTSRAFSDLPLLIAITQHLVAGSGIWLAMKGHVPEDELAGLTLPYQVHTFNVNGIEAARCCVIIHQCDNKE